MDARPQPLVLDDGKETPAPPAHAVAADPDAPVFYTFPEMGHSVPPYPVMGVAEEALVLSCVSIELLVARLGGCARYVDRRGVAYLGVWGERNIERLRAVLSRRAPNLVVCGERPEASRLEWRRGAVRPGL